MALAASTPPGLRSRGELPTRWLDTQANQPDARQAAARFVAELAPGLYVRPAPGVPEAFWNIGIRIEDDAIVTPDGCELITRDVPVQADEIEALMRAA